MDARRPRWLSNRRSTVLQVGFRLPAHDDMRIKLAQLRAEGPEITEYHDEPEYVAFKCADPDGHQVELYWEPSMEACRTL